MFYRIFHILWFFFLSRNLVLNEPMFFLLLFFFFNIIQVSTHLTHLFYTIWQWYLHFNLKSLRLHLFTTLVLNSYDTSILYYYFIILYYNNMCFVGEFYQTHITALFFIQYIHGIFIECIKCIIILIH